MEKKGKPIRRILDIALFAAGVAFCIAAFLGHESAYSAAAVCFFADTASIVGRKQEK